MRTTRRFALQLLTGGTVLVALQRHARSRELAQAIERNLLESTQIANAEEAAALVLKQAREAAAKGTFGVGGAMVENKSGRIVKTMRNRVMVRLGDNLGRLSGKSFTHDPTAHGERQLISWYFANRRQLKLPDPDQMTIVTSLDPCAMCAGSIAAAGFNVAVVADDTFAGVNWNGQFDFAAYPPAINQALHSRFGYYAIKQKRRFVGNKAVIFSAQSISQQTAAGCETIFTDSAEAVRQQSSNSGPSLDKLKNPTSLGATSALIAEWKRQFPDAFSIRLENFRKPSEELKAHLETLLSKQQNARNAVALIDPFGNLLATATDHFETSPIDTAFMRLTQNYAKARFECINNSRVSEDAQQCLTSPKYGTFVFLYAPDPNSTLTLKDLGAYGSTMEGPVPVATPSNFQFYNDPRHGTQAELRDLIQAMPPFYRDLVNINPQPVLMT